MHVVHLAEACAVAHGPSSASLALGKAKRSHQTPVPKSTFLLFACPPRRECCGPKAPVCNAACFARPADAFCAHMRSLDSTVRCVFMGLSASVKASGEKSRARFPLFMFSQSTWMLVPQGARPAAISLEAGSFACRRISIFGFPCPV